MKTMLKAIIALTLAATAGFSSANEKLTVGITPTISNAPLYVAKARGIFEKHGLDVEFVESDAPVLLAGVVAGSVDITSPTMTTILQSLDSGLDLSIIAGFNIITKAQQDQSVVIREGVDIKAPSDFEGKTIGVPGIGATLHVMFTHWLTQNGADASKIRFVEIPFPQGGDVLKQGTVDAVVTVGPFTDRIIGAKIGHMGPRFTAELPEGLPIIGFIATNNWIGSHAETVERFRAAMTEASAEVAKDQDAAKDDSNKFLNMPPQLMAQIRLPAYSAAMKPELIQAWIDMMKPMALIQGDLNPVKILLK